MDFHAIMKHSHTMKIKKQTKITMNNIHHL